MAALPGSDKPSDSTMLAMVDAVPIVMLWPADRCIQDSAATNSSIAICPPRTASDICQTPVPEPMSRPLYFPFSIGPPEIPIVGTLQDAAPMRSDGVVLSQ